LQARPGSLRCQRRSRNKPASPALDTTPACGARRCFGGRPKARMGAPHGAFETDRMPVRFSFDNSDARLPKRRYARLDPTPVAAPRLVRLNAGLAESLGLDPEELTSPEGVEVLAGKPRARDCGAARACLCRAPARPLRSAARRRPCYPARRGGGAGRCTAGHPAQRFRALAAVTTGQPVLRETVLPGASLTRVAASHIRVGTFRGTA